MRYNSTRRDCEASVFQRSVTEKHSYSNKSGVITCGNQFSPDSRENIKRRESARPKLNLKAAKRRHLKAFLFLFPYLSLFIPFSTFFFFIDLCRPMINTNFNFLPILKVLVFSLYFACFLKHNTIKILVFSKKNSNPDRDSDLRPTDF